MTMSYEQAVAVQRRHEQRLIALPGVSAVGVKMHDGAPVLAVTLDDEAEPSAELMSGQIDGLDLLIERGRYRAQ